MAQAFLCPACRAAYTAELRGHSCPACGEELIHGRFPAGSTYTKITSRSKSPGVGRAVWDHMIKKDPCAYCGCGRSSTVDHIHPKALGGSKGSWTNRAGSCFRCNQDKAHTPLLFFMLEQQGTDISFLKDEEGNWPIPKTPEEVEKMVKHEEATAQPERFDVHAIMREWLMEEEQAAA